MRCSHHETDSVPIPVPASTHDEPEIIDFYDDADELDILAVPDNNIFDDEGQIFTEVKNNGNKKDENLLEWFATTGRSINPTPLKLLKYAERAIAKYEAARLNMMQMEKEGVKFAQSKAADNANICRSHFSAYVKRFRTAPVLNNVLLFHGAMTML